MNFNPKAPPVYRPATSKLAPPPVYQPQALASRLQLKPAVSSTLERRPAPSVYRPQQTAASTAPVPKPLISRQSENAIGSPRFVQRRELTLPKPLARLPRNPAQGTDTVTTRQGSTTHVIQRALDPVEAAKLKIKGREKKKEDMAKFAAAKKALYRKRKKPSPEFAEEFKMVDSLSFGGNRSSAALIANASGDVVYVAGQQGGAGKAPEEMWDLSGAEVIATDCERSPGLHSEMQTIVTLLREWKESEEFGTTTAEKYLTDRLAGGKAVAKGKGCCQLCAAILLKLGVKVAFIEPSKYEATWQDPFEFVELENPWF